MTLNVPSSLLCLLFTVVIIQIPFTFFHPHASYVPLEHNLQCHFLRDPLFSSFFVPIIYPSNPCLPSHFYFPLMHFISPLSTTCTVDFSPSSFPLSSSFFVFPLIVLCCPLALSAPFFFLPLTFFFLLSSCAFYFPRNP